MNRISKGMILGVVGLPLVIATVAVVLSRSSSDGTETSGASEEEGIPVSVQMVASETIMETISGVGTVEAWHRNGGERQAGILAWQQF